MQARAVSVKCTITNGPAPKSERGTGQVQEILSTQ